MGRSEKETRAIGRKPWVGGSEILGKRRVNLKKDMSVQPTLIAIMSTCKSKVESVGSRKMWGNLSEIDEGERCRTGLEGWSREG